MGCLSTTSACNCAAVGVVNYSYPHIGIYDGRRPGKKDEEKFDFTAEGEALGYVSLDQAQVLAIRHARETPGAYGATYVDVPMAFDVVESDDTEDHYRITLSFRPEGAFTGTPGREQFFIEKEGNVAVRQVLSLPERAGWRRYRLALVAVGLVVVAAGAIGGVLAASGSGGGGNDDSAGQVVAALPTSTPVPSVSTPVPSPTTAPTIAPPLGATATPKPIILTATTMSKLVGRLIALPRATATPVASPTPTPPLSPTPVPRPDFTPIPTSTPGPTSTPTPTPLPTPTRPPTPSPTLMPGISAGSVVEIQYQHRVWLKPGPTFETEWDPGETAYEPRWDFNLSELVSLIANFDSPLAVRSMTYRPLPIDQAQEKYTYGWLPAPKLYAMVERKLIVDSGLRLSRNIAPKTLPPGATQVVIDVAVEIVRPPTVSGITVVPLEAHMNIAIGGGVEFRAGAESKANGGIRPVRVISVSGPVFGHLGPLLKPGQKDNLRIEAVIDNPNLFPVSYIPNVGVNLDFDADSDAAPFKVSIPG